MGSQWLLFLLKLIHIRSFEYYLAVPAPHNKKTPKKPKKNLLNGDLDSEDKLSEPLIYCVTIENLIIIIFLCFQNCLHCDTCATGFKNKSQTVY